VFSTLNPVAFLTATLATLVLIAAIFLGSRNLGNFDAALVAYLFGCIFVCFGVVYRYTVWLQRPPTWRYFLRGWQLFFSGRVIVYGWELARHFVVNFLGQRFIQKRGRALGRGHMLMAWGCILAFGVTFPLVFGWIHFGLKPGGIDTYEICTFGFKTMEFPLHTWIATLIFNALNWSALLVIAGVMLLMRRRLTHAGQIAVRLPSVARQRACGLCCRGGCANRLSAFHRPLTQGPLQQDLSYDGDQRPSAWRMILAGQPGFWFIGGESGDSMPDVPQ
jgi:hypothetical protein